MRYYHARLFVPEERGDHLQVLRLGHVEECEGTEQRQEPGHVHPTKRGFYPVKKIFSPSPLALTDHQIHKNVMSI